MSGPASVSGAVSRPLILELLTGVAPDIDPAAVRPEVDFRDQFDFDSMDLFNFAAALHQRFGIDIPERDYRNVMSVAKCEAYLRQKVPAS